VPPAGWLCSRKCGHSGPCAASPSWWNRIVIWVKNFWS
jgi:hypothetical protein